MRVSKVEIYVKDSLREKLLQPESKDIRKAIKLLRK